MASYMPALTPVIIRPRNASRLFATPTPGQDQHESSDNEEVLSEKNKKDLEATPPPAFNPDYTQTNNPPTDRDKGDVNLDLAGMITGGTPGSPLSAEQVAAAGGTGAEVVIGPDGRPVIPELIVTAGKGNEMLNILVNDSFSTNKSGKKKTKKGKGKDKEKEKSKKKNKAGFSAMEILQMKDEE